MMKHSLGETAIIRIAGVLEKTICDFDKSKFVSQAKTGIELLELKQRVNHIITCLHQVFPDDFNQTVKVLIKIKDNWDYGDLKDKFRGFAAWPIIDYIAVYGLEHPKAALFALKNLTSLFSAEFAIRPFILKYPELCDQHFQLWVKDESEDVRRLVSEGARPRLPWGLQLKPHIINPSINLPLLTAMKNDPSLYVRRSIANHLNDITKDHPSIVTELCKSWQSEIDHNEDVQWIIKHATRSLIKQGNSDALSLLGFTKTPKVSVSEITLGKNNVSDCTPLNFSFKLKSKTSIKQKLVIDYAIHFVKANGSHNAKVFKIKNIELSNNQQIEITKSFSFKPISTRKYYQGEHKIEILVNGQSMACSTFILN